MIPLFVALLGREEAKAKTEPTPVIPPTPPMSPQDELALLEKSALEKGMTEDELNEIRSIGECEQQVQTRIASLHAWLRSH